MFILFWECNPNYCYSLYYSSCRSSGPWEFSFLPGLWRGNRHWCLCPFSGSSPAHLPFHLLAPSHFPATQKVPGSFYIFLVLVPENFVLQYLETEIWEVVWPLLLQCHCFLTSQWIQPGYACTGIGSYVHTHIYLHVFFYQYRYSHNLCMTLYWHLFRGFSTPVPTIAFFPFPYL